MKMEVFYTIEDTYQYNKNFDGSLITLGNFDGIHIGHQYILSEMKKFKHASEKKLSLGIITFSPHSKLFFRPETKNFILYPDEVKIEVFRKLGFIDYILFLPFNKEFSSCLGEEFINNYICKMGSLEKLFLGHDFCFGQDKLRDNKIVEKLIKERSPSSELSFLDQYQLGGEGVSSSIIRSLLGEGNLDLAEKFLGRKFYNIGQVVSGRQMGRKLGFPTANLLISPSFKIPRSGVYATNINYKGKSYRGLTNIGTRPTFDGKGITHETHILEFDNELLGEFLEIEYLAYIREEMRFNSPVELVEQINQDKKKLEALNIF